MRADRLLSILLRLQANKKMTAGQLANELEVSIRTIYRDIDALSMAGVPVYTQRGEDGGCFLDEEYRVSLTNLKLPELQALFVMGGTAPLEALNINRNIEDGLLKILASLPSQNQAEAKMLQQRLFIDTRNWNQIDDTLPFLDVIQTAVWHDQIIEAHYQSVGKEAKLRHLKPYGLVVKAHIWYVIARPIDEDDFRVYRLSRFQSITVTDKRFQRQPNFDLKAIWDQKRQAFETLIRADYTVTMKIPHHLITPLDYFIPDRYQIVEQTEEDTLLQAHFYNINEARHIILGFGNRVEVIAPQSLADSIFEFAESIVNMRS